MTTDKRHQYSKQQVNNKHHVEYENFCFFFFIYWTTTLLKNDMNLVSINERKHVGGTTSKNHTSFNLDSPCPFSAFGCEMWTFKKRKASKNQPKKNAKTNDCWFRRWKRERENEREKHLNSQNWWFKQNNNASYYLWS